MQQLTQIFRLILAGFCQASPCGLCPCSFAAPMRTLKPSNIHKRTYNVKDNQIPFSSFHMPFRSTHPDFQVYLVGMYRNIFYSLSKRCGLSSWGLRSYKINQSNHLYRKILLWVEFQQLLYTSSGRLYNPMRAIMVQFVGMAVDSAIVTDAWDFLITAP